MQLPLFPNAYVTTRTLAITSENAVNSEMLAKSEGGILMKFRLQNNIAQTFEKRFFTAQSSRASSQCSPWIENEYNVCRLSQ